MRRHDSSEVVCCFEGYGGIVVIPDGGGWVSVGEEDFCSSTPPIVGGARH